MSERIDAEMTKPEVLAEVERQGLDARTRDLKGDLVARLASLSRPGRYVTDHAPGDPVGSYTRRGVS